MNEDGVPLAHYREHPGAAVDLHCSCGKSKRIGLETAIAVAGAAASVRSVWRFAALPCACGRRYTDSRPAFRRPRPAGD